MYTFIAKMQAMIRPYTGHFYASEALAVKAVSKESVERNGTWK
jgi:hypothetical protein